MVFRGGVCVCVCACVCSAGPAMAQRPGARAPGMGHGPGRSTMVVSRASLERSSGPLPHGHACGGWACSTAAAAVPRGSLARPSPQMFGPPPDRGPNWLAACAAHGLAAPDKQLRLGPLAAAAVRQFGGGGGGSVLQGMRVYTASHRRGNVVEPRGRCFLLSSTEKSARRLRWISARGPKPPARARRAPTRIESAARLNAPNE